MIECYMYCIELCVVSEVSRVQSLPSFPYPMKQYTVNRIKRKKYHKTLVEYQERYLCER